MRNISSFIPSFLHSFIPSFLHSFISSFLHSFISSFPFWGEAIAKRSRALPAERVKKVFLPRSVRFSELQKSSENLLYWTRRDTLTVSLHRTLPSEIVARSGFLTDGRRLCDFRTADVIFISLFPRARPRCGSSCGAVRSRPPSDLPSADPGSPRRASDRSAAYSLCPAR